MSDPTPLEELRQAVQTVKALPKTVDRKTGIRLVEETARIIDDNPGHARQAVAALKNELVQQEILPDEPDKP